VIFSPPSKYTDKTDETPPWVLLPASQDALKNSHSLKMNCQNRQNPSVAATSRATGRREK